MIPISANCITSAVPPYEKKGSAIPVVGTDYVTPAISSIA